MVLSPDLGNGSHRIPAYFEWWYFHFVTPDGVAINMVAHETDTLGLSQQPYLSLSILMSGQLPRYLRRDIPGIANGRCQPFLSVGEGMITETAQNIVFAIEFPGEGFFKGKISKQTPELVIENGLLYVDEATGQASYWVVPVPHAAFTAVLQLDDACWHLSGQAYHDHQWGTLPLQTFVSDWVWGQFSNDEMAVIFFQILTQQGRWIERIAMITENGRYTGTAVATTYLKTLFQTSTLDTFHDRVEVSFLNDLAQLSFEVDPARLMRRRLNEARGDVVASYLRWAAVAIYHAGGIVQPLYGITEYIRIRPAFHENVSHSEHR